MVKETPAPIPSALALAGALLLVVVYFGILVLFGIWLSGMIVSELGVVNSSGLGLICTILGAVVYITFEIAIFISARPPPLLGVIIAIVMVPFTIAWGISAISKEYERIENLLSDIPSIISRVLPFRTVV